MSRKKRSRGASGSTEGEGADAAGSGRKQRRSEKIRQQREARKAAEQKKNQGVRPWIMPGCVGIAVLLPGRYLVEVMSEPAVTFEGVDVPPGEQVELAASGTAS